MVVAFAANTMYGNNNDNPIMKQVTGIRVTGCFESLLINASMGLIDILYLNGVILGSLGRPR